MHGLTLFSRARSLKDGEVKPLASLPYEIHARCAGEGKGSQTCALCNVGRQPAAGRTAATYDQAHARRSDAARQHVCLGCVHGGIDLGYTSFG